MSVKWINLALQGGGSHGALTWGVLDRILEDERLMIGDISGTSAGAMNAAVLAAGMHIGGREGARAALRRFWGAVSDAARFSPVQRSFADRLLGRWSLDHSPGYLWLEGLQRVFSPYELNPFGLNPLRRILDAHVNFDHVNGCRQVAVHVTATHVRSGKARVFSRGEVTAEAVMASACLPQSTPAVVIEGEAYWDGGFSGNPALTPLIESPRSDDIVIVQINPIIRDAVPRSAREIINRVNEISFNASLLKELQAIALLRRHWREEHDDPAERGAAAALIHLIHVDAEVQDLAASSKMNAEAAYLDLLFKRGRHWAEAWLEAHWDDLGQRSTFDPGQFFDEPAWMGTGGRLAG
ncbi:patatin-like phospholipase family protein [Paracoccus sp. S-4012]|uniref:patatin-like phospholipase family protein n=1 Tax=Paracoccus sp. S-4012 TaxID=2665648 RepID=UPI00132C2027|nr:patatin-like phospholipase family protein [Paracoccus sp. S-4012]